MTNFSGNPLLEPKKPELTLQDPRRTAAGIDPAYESLMGSAMRESAVNDALVDPDPQGPGSTAVDPAWNTILQQDLEAQKQGDAAVMRALMAASEVDPELAGEAQRLGIELGMEPELVEANIEKARELWNQRQVQALFSSGGNQQTMTAMLDPRFARIASDDVQNLSWLENLWQQRDAAKLEERQSLLWDEIRQGIAGPKAMAEIEDISRQLAELPSGSDVGGFFENLTYGAMRTWSGMEESLLVSLGAGTTLAGAAVVAGQAGPQVALPEEILSVPGMFSAGFFGTMSVMSAAREGGASYGQMIDMGVDPAIARRWSGVVGVVNGALEAVSAGVLSAPFKAEAKRLLTRQVAKDMLINPTATSAAKRFAITYAKGLGAEVGTEVMQEISNVLGEGVARWQQEGIDASTLKETDPFFDRMGAIIGETLRGMALLGLPGPLLQLRTDMSRAKQGAIDEKWVSNLGKGVDQAKTRPRNRRMFARFLEQLAEGTDADSLYVSFEEFEKQLADVGMTRAQLAEFAPEIAERLREARQTGLVEIPTSEFGAEFLSTEFGKSLIPHARVTPEGVTPQEIATVQKQELDEQTERAEKLLEEFGEKDSNYKAQADLIEQRFADQIVAAGRKPAEATVAARYYRNLALILAAEEGMTPAEWQQQHGADLMSEAEFAELDIGEQGEVQQVGTPEFRAWFGGSLATEDGERGSAPRVYYHGTNQDFTVFDREAAQRVFGHAPSMDSVGSWFSTSSDAAQNYASNAAIVPVYLAINRPARMSFDEFLKMGQMTDFEFDEATQAPGGFDGAAVREHLQSEGFDGIVFTDPSIDGFDQEVWVAFEPEQIKSAIANRGTFDPSSPNMLEQVKLGKPHEKPPAGDLKSGGKNLEDGNVLGFWKWLRVKTRRKPKKAKILTGTNNKNAAKQIAELDGVLEAHPDAHESATKWASMLADAFGSQEVPVPPFAFIRDLKGKRMFEKLRVLTKGQLDDANHGFANAREFRRAYLAGEIDVATTGKLFLWSFLSRGVSPYTQESLFIDSFDGAAPWIEKAARGEFTEADLEAYYEWTATTAPKGSGQPGASSMHNLNAFGKSFLMKMAQRREDGRTNMQYLHDLIADGELTGQQIRREFQTFGEGVGIDNKVVSFSLLVAGFEDVMVLDRVQVRQLWDDGRFNGYNLYDGITEERVVKGKTKPVKITGSSLTELTMGVRGLLIYEAVERALSTRVQELYTELGRPDDASIGRYHWESWVADSQQEASHGTIDAILEDAKGNDDAIAQVTAKEGEYSTYHYGARYGVDQDGVGYFLYQVPGGSLHRFSVPEFRAFVEKVKSSGGGVVPKGFRITPPKKGPVPPEYSKPWYDRDGINTERLEELAVEFAGERVPPAPTRPEGGTAAGGARPRAVASLEQREVRAQRAGRFLPDLRLILLDGENSQPTTVLHELSHFWFFGVLDMAERGTASARLLGDIDTLLQWFKIEGATAEERLATWQSMDLDQQRKHHETLAYNFEVYLFDGKAPTSKLEAVFAKIRTFVLNTYEAVRDNLNAIFRDQFGEDLPGLTPEVRAVFDRMVASRRAVEATESARAMRPMFQTLEEFTAAGYAEEQWDEYQRVLEEAREEAVTDLTAATLKQLKWLRNARGRMLKEWQREVKRTREAVRKRVQGEVEDEHTYMAMEILRDEKAASKLREEDVDRVLAELPAKERAQIKKKLGTGRKGLMSKSGIPADVLAEQLGYRSGDEMVRDFYHARPIDQEIELRTTQALLEEHGELVDKQAIQERIDRALHKEARARFVATELRFLEGTGRPARVQIAAAKDAARRALGSRKIREIRSDRFFQAEAQAARAAERAMKKGDPNAAADAKRQQLLWNQVAAMSYKVKGEVRKMLGSFRKLMRGQEALAKIGDVGVLEAARWVLAQYGLATQGAAQRSVDYMKLLREYDPALFARLEPELAKAQRRGAELGRLKNGAPNWRELTLDELRTVHDTVETLVYRAQRDQQIVVNGKLEKLETAVAELMGGIKIPTEVAGESGALTFWQRAKMRLLGTRANLVKIEHYLRALDDGQQGPFLRYLFNEVRGSVDAYRSDAAVYVKKLVDLVADMRRRGLLEDGKIDAQEELGYTFGNGNRGGGMAELVGALLHLGNAGNKERFLVAGRGPNHSWADIDAEGNFDYSRWDRFIARMVKDGKLKREHFDFAQQVWDLMEEIKPKLQEAHRELDGRFFKEVPADPFTMEFENGESVTYRGGYVPAARDTDLLPPGEIKLTVEEMQQDFFNGLPSTPDGFVKERAARYHKRPLAMDINKIGAHIDESLRYAHVQPRVADVLRIIGNEELATALTRMDPNLIRELLIPYLERAVRQSIYDKGKDPTQDWFWKMVRRNTGVAIMFGNVVNSLQQLTGISNSLQYVKGRHLKHALYTYMRERGDLADAIIEKSEFMDDRLRNQMLGLTQDLRELMLDPSAIARVQTWIGKKAYFMQTFTQNQVDIVTWWGAYQQAIENGAIEADAVTEANSAVRLAQGSFNPEDVAGYEVGTPLARTWTQFTSYFNTVANQIAFAKGSRAKAAVLTFTIPMVAAQAIAMTLWGQWDDEDDDGHWDTTFDLFVGSQLGGAAAMIPGYGPAAYGLVSQAFSDRDFGDRVAASPAMVSVQRSLAGLFGLASGDQPTGRRVRDGLTAAVILIPGAGVIAPAIRPTGYLVDVGRGDVKPTGPVDATLGFLSGRASEASRR